MVVPGSTKFPFFLILLVLAFKTQKTQAHFVLKYVIISITTQAHVTNSVGDESTPQCKSYLSNFCLREGRNTSSNDASDCPLGFGSSIDRRVEYQVMREIMSQQPRTVSKLIESPGTGPSFTVLHA